MGRRRKKVGARDKDMNVNADDIPAGSKEVVRRLKEIVEFSEQEIYKMLLECNMDINEAVSQLLSQAETFQEVKTKRDQKKENLELRNGGKMLDSDETSNVQETNDHHLADSSTTSSIDDPQNSDPTNAETNRVSINSGEGVTSLSVPSSSDLTNAETNRVPINSGEGVTSLSVPFSSDLTNAETKKVPVSSGAAVPLLAVPSSSDLTNAETNRVPLSSGAAVPLLAVPSSSYLTNAKTKKVPVSSGAAVPSLAVPSSRLISGERTMAEVVKMSLGLLKESVTNATVKDDSPLHEKPDVPDSFSSASIEPARSDQLPESASIFNQNLRDDCYGGLRLFFDENDEIYQLHRRSFEHDRTKDTSASVVTSLQQLSIENHESANEPRRLRFGSGLFGLPSGHPSQTWNTRGDEISEEEQEQLWRDVANDQMAYQMEVIASRNHNSSSHQLETEPVQYETREPGRENQHKSSSATDFTFDNSQLSEPSLPLQNFNSFPAVMTVPATTSLGHRPPISMAERNRQAMNHHYSQPQPPNVPSGHYYGNKMKSPKQNDNYNVLPSGFQQHQSQASMHPQNSNSNLPQSAVADLVPSATNSSNQLPLFQHQNIYSNVWPPVQGNDTYSLFPGYQNQQLPSFRHSQQQEQEQEQQLYRAFGYGSNNPYYASPDQQNKRSNPSNQTQKRFWPRNNQ